MSRHITDSNSWPLDLTSHPELAKKAAYSAEQTFSEADIRDIIEYAGEVSPCLPGTSTN
jgi:hexosaminidase